MNLRSESNGIASSRGRPLTLRLPTPIPARSRRLEQRDLLVGLSLYRRCTGTAARSSEHELVAPQLA